MLNSSSPIALYEQLKILIKNDITNGVYKPGDKLPNENKLCEVYDVSRITVRRAIKELADKDLVEIRQGKGTFIKEPKMNFRILDLGGYSDTFSNQNHLLEKKTLEKGIITLSDEIAKDFKIPIGSKVLRLKRLIMDEGHPLSVDTSYFPEEIYPDMSEKIIDNISTFNIMQKEYGIVMDSVYKEFSVVTANSELSELFNCMLAEPLFKVKKVICNPEGIPIHLSVYYILSSRVKYFINIENVSKDN